MNPVLHQWLSVAVLGGLLFIPVSNIIWVLSVRRLQRKGAVDAHATAVQRTRARVLALPLVTLFAYLFYHGVIGGLYR